MSLHHKSVPSSERPAFGEARLRRRAPSFRFEKCLSRYSVHGTRQQGFTLIEALMAILILASGLVLVIEAMGRTQQAVRVSENLVKASRIAEQQFVASQLQVLQEHGLDAGSDSGDVRFPGRRFNWTKKITPYTDPTIKDETKLNQVEVSVRWEEAGKDHSLKLSSLILNREKQQ